MKLKLKLKVKFLHLFIFKSKYKIRTCLIEFLLKLYLMLCKYYFDK